MTTALYKGVYRSQCAIVDEQIIVAGVASGDQEVWLW